MPLTSESQLHTIFVTVKNQEIKLNFIYNPNYLFDNQQLFPYGMYVKLQLCIQDTSCYSHNPQWIPENEKDSMKLGFSS